MFTDSPKRQWPLFTGPSQLAFVRMPNTAYSPPLVGNQRLVGRFEDHPAGEAIPGRIQAGKFCLFDINPA
jgi:hypothetical protein